MPFNVHQMLVFNRSGARVGTISTWTITSPRTFRIAEICDMTVEIPNRDSAGNVVFNSAMDALLIEDNILYVENEMDGIPGWGGAIIEKEYVNDGLILTLNSGESLLAGLETTTITQNAGDSATIASRLVSAANAKQGAHGDVLVTFSNDGTTPNYGTYTYEGDIFQGLQQLATDSLAEFYVQAVLGAGAASISFVLHWNSTFANDLSGVITISDGTSGQLAQGTSFKFSVMEVFNRIRLRGASTSFADYLNYDCVKSVVKDLTPEVDWIAEGATNLRRRENLNLSVNFSLSSDAQQAIATTGYDIDDPNNPGTLLHVKGLEELYLDYYKSFLYYHHNRLGRPFLDGYDWSGPDGTNDKSLTMRYMRTLQKLGRIGAATVVTAGSDNATIGAAIDQWAFDQNVSPDGTGTVGVALDYATFTDHWFADSNGNLYLQPTDYTNPDAPTFIPANATLWGTPGSGTLVAVATDPAQVNTVWVMNQSGGNTTVSAYDIDSHALLSSFTIGQTLNDFALDYVNGVFMAVNPGSGTVQVRDINSGALLSPDLSFASGLSNATGISVSGGIAYVSDAAGHISMVYADVTQPATLGQVAGSFSSGLATDGLYVDLSNRRIWLIQSGGGITLYHAYVAQATVAPPGSLTGAPGFDTIYSGQFVHIVMTSDGAYVSKPHVTSSGTYTVVSGDTLWGIADHFYGNGSQWPTIYNANKAYLDGITAGHGLTPGPHWIFPGEVISIPGIGGKVTHNAPAPATKYLTTHTPGEWQLTTIPAPDPAQPDQLQRSWVTGDTQVTGFVLASVCAIQDPAVVILGEEGRVCDWAPATDGYGIFRDTQQFLTARGHVRSEGPGWYWHVWDVPARTFEPDQPDWPEGKAYLAAYLAKHNKRITVQTIHVLNIANLWNSIQIGTIVMVHSSTQGPQPGGTTLKMRVIAFAPDEFNGTMEITGEIVS